MKNSTKKSIYFLVIIQLLFVLIIIYYTYYIKRIDAKDKYIIEQYRKEESIHKTIPKHDKTNTYEYRINQPEYDDNADNFTTKKDTYTEFTSELDKANIDCIINIPKINLEKPVYTGVNRAKQLEQYELITATEDMRYINGSNYIICGHASRIYGHSFNRLKELTKGDIIQIEHENKQTQYYITEILYKDKNQCSDHFNPSTYSMITLVSCAKYISEECYIIIHAIEK